MFKWIFSLQFQSYFGAVGCLVELLKTGESSSDRKESFQTDRKSSHEQTSLPNKTTSDCKKSDHGTTIVENHTEALTKNIETLTNNVEILKSNVENSKVAGYDYVKILTSVSQNPAHGLSEENVLEMRSRLGPFPLAKNLAAELIKVIKCDQNIPAVLNHENNNEVRTIDNEVRTDNEVNHGNEVRCISNRSEMRLQDFMQQVMFDDFTLS